MDPRLRALPPSSGSARWPTPLPGLTPRENEVAELAGQGCSNREIADALHISEGSARNIISVVLEKLNLRDRTQLAIHYWRRTL